MTDDPLPFDPSDSTFNRLNALYLAHASSIAYKRSPSAAARKHLGLKTVSFRNKITRTRGYLGICDTHAVLAFRGTEPVTLPNWLTDVVVKLVEHDEYDGHVHHGFGSALRRTWAMVEAVFDQAEEKPLFVTGHSMGGALAVLAACRLARAGRSPVATYTFGSPRIGDAVFCAGHRLPTYRIVNRLDLVPELPLTSMKRIVPAKVRSVKERLRRPRANANAPALCYGHVKTFVHIDRDGVITADADVTPWRAHAVQRAIATRGKSFLEGITDHLIGSYIRGLEGQIGKKQTGVRRRVRAD